MPDSKSTHNIIPLYIIGLAPSTHHPSVIEGNDTNRINPLCLELGQMVDESRKVAG